MESLQTNSLPVEHPRGVHTGKVDEKGRLKLSTDYQKYLNDLGDKRVFITSFDGRIARIYPIGSWKRNEAMLAEDNENAEENDDLLFYANSMGGDAEPDTQGRLLFPSQLRKAMNLEDQPVYLEYSREHINVFTQAVYDERMERARQNLAEKLKSAEKRGLK